MSHEWRPYRFAIWKSLRRQSRLAGIFRVYQSSPRPSNIEPSLSALKVKGDSGRFLTLFAHNNPNTHAYKLDELWPIGPSECKRNFSPAFTRLFSIQKPFTSGSPGALLLNGIFSSKVPAFASVSFFEFRSPYTNVRQSSQSLGFH